MKWKQNDNLGRYSIYTLFRVGTLNTAIYTFYIKADGFKIIENPVIAHLDSAPLPL